jgi:hypothetical protein
LRGPHRGLAEDRLDVDDPDPAHLEEVLEDRRAASFERVGRGPVQLDDVVGDQPVAAADQLQRELALADRRCAGDQHADLEHVEEHAVQRRRFGEHPRQVDPQHLDDVRDGCADEKTACCSRSACCGEMRRDRLVGWRR